MIELRILAPSLWDWYYDIGIRHILLWLPLPETDDNDDKWPHAAAFAPEVCVSASGSKITSVEEAPLTQIELCSVEAHSTENNNILWDKIEWHVIIRSSTSAGLFVQAPLNNNTPNVDT